MAGRTEAAVVAWNTEGTPRACRCWENPPVIGGYPLVNLQKTMENHHFSWENPL